jgi:indolepyruvate ferredoxin oxidoreductase beta subunit
MVSELMVENNKTMMLVGVGGQGLLLAAQVLTEGLIRSGFDVRSSEEHGMAQRGGSVVTQLSFGEKVYAPVFGEGVVDYIMALEKLEALRYAHFLRRKGILLVNDLEIPSLPILIGKTAYPVDIVPRLQSFDLTCRVLPATQKARELGNDRVLNIVMLGAMLRLAGLTSLTDWQAVVGDVVKPAFREINLQALLTGMALVE